MTKRIKKRLEYDSLSPGFVQDKKTWKICYLSQILSGESCMNSDLSVVSAFYDRTEATDRSEACFLESIAIIFTIRFGH